MLFRRTAVARLFAHQKKGAVKQPTYYIPFNSKNDDCQKHNSTKVFLLPCKSAADILLPARYITGDPAA